MTHKMKLDDVPFQNIKNGTKKIELRLNDEKRQLLKIGDFIEFTNRETLEKCKVKIKNLHYETSFEKLFLKFSPSMLGYYNNETPDPKDMEKYYSKEEQEKYGVLGIEISLEKENKF